MRPQSYRFQRAVVAIIPRRSAGGILHGSTYISSSSNSMDFETYSHSKRFEYAELAEIVSSILGAALKAYPATFRLQQVQHRAKNIDSLKKKLEDRNILS